MSIEAMKQALEALEKSVDNFMANTQHQQAITTLRQAIAEAEKQEPVAWMDEYGDVLSASVVDGKGLRNIPLYTHPPKREWVGLIDENQRLRAELKFNTTKREWVGLNRMELIKCGVLPFGNSYALYEAIEAKLKEKNT